MRKRQTVLHALGFAMLLYSLINALGSGQVLCGSLGCQALQKPALWWAGAAYALMLLGVAHFRRPLLGGVIVIGTVVESALVLTQVILNLYCPACLGYTALFLLFVVLAGFQMNPLAKKTTWAVAGTTLCIAVTIVPLARTVCACSESPFSRVSGDEQSLYLFFEPTCGHCHSVLEMLEKMEARNRVRLCPEAWSLASVWALVRDHCHTCTAWKDRARCLLSTLTVVRANNAFCMERGLPYVPLIVHQGRIVTGSEVPGYLLSVLRDPLAASQAHPLLLPSEPGGSCTVNACD
jgi:thiol-disulfide isomerase/thioredoxin